MSTRIDIDSRLAQLGSSDAKARDLAAAELGDILEANVLAFPQLEKVVRKLLTAATRETDPVARESIYNALGESDRTEGADKLNWDPLAEVLDSLPPDCLEHALYLLGFAGKAEYAEKVRRFASHPDKDVRETALASLAQIEAQKRAASRPRSRARRMG